MVKSYYEILEISETKEKKDIKRAYAKMVKKYRPETNPKEFEQVREAYEKLLEYIENDIDIDNKIEDYERVINNNYASEDINVIEEINLLKKEKNYDKAIYICKKSILSSHQNKILINELGVLYIYKNEIDKAIKQFEEALKIDDKLDITYGNLAHAYLKNKQYDLALQNYEKAYKLSNKDTWYIKEILNLCTLRKDKNKILHTLENEYLSKKESIKHYIDLVKLSLEEGENALVEILNDIVNTFNQTEYASKVSYELYKICVLLEQKKQIGYCNILINYGIKLDPLEEFYSLKNKINLEVENKQLNYQLDKITYDNRLNYNLIELVTKICKDNSDDLSTNINLVSNIDYKELIIETEVIEYEYNHIYDKSKFILNKILKNKKIKLNINRLLIIAAIVIVLGATIQYI